MKNLSLIFIFLLPLLSSCLKDEKSILIFEIKSDTKALLSADDEDTTDDEFSFETSPATFENVLKHVFQDKCLGCHSAEFAELGVDLSQYETIFDMSDFFTPVVTAKDPENSGVFLEIESGRMPPRKELSPKEIAFIKKWIEEGAVE